MIQVQNVYIAVDKIVSVNQQSMKIHHSMPTILCYALNIFYIDKHRDSFYYDKKENLETDLNKIVETYNKQAQIENQIDFKDVLPPPPIEGKEDGILNYGF